MTALTPVLTDAWRLRDYWLRAFVRTIRGMAVGALVTPILYVVAMGVMLGGFIAADPATLEGAGSYLSFVAPGLVASQAMTTVFGEATYPVIGMIIWDKTYYSMIATPVGPGAVVLAHLAAILARVGLGSAAFLLVLAPFGAFESWWSVLALPVSLLVGLAFAAPIYAFSAGTRNDNSFNLLFRLGMVPMFLFSGAFFPVANLSAPLEAIAKVTPLWHGVSLTRMLTLGTVDPTLALIHLAYLGGLSALGWWWAVRRLSRRLVV
jgi:lipooligosaccharide transport system permease protein